MKKLFVISLVATALMFSAAFAKNKGKSEDADTLTGAVVDVCCYVKYSGKKPDDLKCAQSCIAKGGPVGILDGKTLYLAIGNAEETAQEMLAGYAGKEVTVKGSVFERDGMKIIAIESLMPPGTTRSNMGFREVSPETVK